MARAEALIGIDLFCGAGGVTRGFRDAGIDVRVGIDVEEKFRETYEKNNPGSKFLGGRLESMSAHDILKMVKPKRGEKIVLAACAPCQPFSNQNKRGLVHGFADTRGTLLFEALRVVRELKNIGWPPDFLFLENVPGMNKGAAWHDTKTFLFDNSYALAFETINAADYGVPQNRRRFIAIARRGWEFIDMPEITHGPGRLPCVTVGEALAGIPAVKAGEMSRALDNHRARSLSALNLKRIVAVPKNGGSRSAFTDDLVLDCHKDFKGHKDVYGRMSADRPAPTITTRCVSITNGRFGHPYEDRGITVREAARLQTFPDNYVFYSDSLGLEAKMVGNAVPVLLAEVFGRHLAKILSADKRDQRQAVGVR